MNILIVEERRRAPEVLKVLKDLGHATEVVEDAAAACARLQRGEKPDAIVTRWPLQARSDLMRRVRGDGAGPHVYVLAMLDQAAPAEIAALYEAGLDDFVRRPLIREEMAGRLGTLPRLRQVLAGESGGHHAAAVPEGCTTVAALRAFRHAGMTVTQAIAAMLGPVECEEASPFDAATRKERCASVVLSLAKAEAELCVTLVLEKESLPSFAEDLCGDPAAGPAVLDDMLREMSNMAAGVVQRAALTEDITFTTNLPTNDWDTACRVTAEQSWWVRREGTRSRIGVVVAVRHRANTRVPARGLREGMVVVRDLRNINGALVIAAGTRLTSTTADRLPRIVGDATLIDVAIVA